MPVQTPTDVNAAEGPSASIEFGDAGPVNQLASRLRNLNPEAYAAGQPPNPAGQQPPTGPPPVPGLGQDQAAGAQPPTSQAQPQPQQGGRLNLDWAFPAMPQMGNPRAWREWLADFASHPQAGPALKALARLAERG